MSAFASEASRQSLKSTLDPLLVKATDLVNNPEKAAPGVIFGVTSDKETVYLNHAGTRELGTSELNNDTQFHYFSTTKAITSLAVLQLLDQGKVELDAPAKTYVPEIADIKLIKKSDADIELVKPTTDITIRHLLTHTSGLSYTFLNEDYDALFKKAGVDLFHPNTNLYEHSYLVHEPGTHFSYGQNLEWAGRVVETVSGQTLDQYFQQHIFRPAGITNTTFRPDVKSENYLRLHGRYEGNVVNSPFQPSRDPVYEWGGQGLIGTVDDYLKFIRIWLNHGKGPDGAQIISEKIWKLAIENALPAGVETRLNPSLRPDLITKIDVLSRKDTWTLGFGRNGVEHTTGRPIGSLYWSGIANTYFWIDLENKIGGYYASEILPGREVSSENNDIFETTVYSLLK